MASTPKWERGAHLELSTDEKLDYLYSRDDAQQNEIDANKVKVTPATYPEGTETYNIATIKVGNTTKTLKGKEGGGGGGDIFELKFTATSANGSNTVTANKTYSELRAALQAEKTVIANLTIIDSIYNCSSCSPASNLVEFVFLNSFYLDSQLEVYDISFTADSITLDSAYFPLTPGE